MTARVGRMILTATMTVAITAGCSSTPGATSPGSSDGASAPPASTSSGAAIPEGFPIGSWTTTLTEADLRAGGITAEGELTENAGVFTMTLGADGTWATAQETDAPLRWPVFRGTWTATGSNSFRQRTDFPADFAGDVVDFTWKIEEGALVLEVVNPPDHVLPVIMETHPWTPAI
jgi:hypothetical protein